ncbi:5-formyltetrahydrofolate cyclo-ligase [Xylanimonas cellulosilytica]|uniref:5-formyltetrahydrofolate cyclo-ligase n=1 Tax=Xylanimonas cellulosilytica TaxID=186189 RepID=UPI000660B536|nr:5-formyltetrahydrofolate cyclo-ligase [Xylanimonas cellulosilytica]
MATKTTLRAEVRSRRRARRTGTSTIEAPLAPEFTQSPIPVRVRVEAEGLAHQIRSLTSSMGGVTLPALFAPTPLEPDMSIALGLFDRALLPVLLDEAGDPLSEPRWGLWEAGRALVTLGRPPAQPDGEVLGAESLKEADLIVIPALAASTDGTRLGQGGGWYDRALTHRSPDTPVVAAIFDDEVLEAGIIPADPHDIPIDVIVTPTRTIATNVR